MYLPAVLHLQWWSRLLCVVLGVGKTHTDQSGAEPTYRARVMAFGGSLAEHFIRYTIHNGINGIKNEGRHIKNTKPLRKPKCKLVQCSSWYWFLCSESTPVKFVRAHAHAPELIRRSAHTFVSSESREHTQLCSLNYVHVFICLYWQ